MLSCDCTRYIAVFDWLENLERQQSGSYKLVSYWPVEISAIPGFFYDFREIRCHYSYTEQFYEISFQFQHRMKRSVFFASCQNKRKILGVGTVWVLSSRVLTLYNKLTLIKPGFHISGKSQTIGDYTFSRLSQIFPIISLMERDTMFICDRGTGAKQFRKQIHRRRTPTFPMVQI